MDDITKTQTHERTFTFISKNGFTYIFLPGLSSHQSATQLHSEMYLHAFYRFDDIQSLCKLCKLLSVSSAAHCLLTSGILFSGSYISSVHEMLLKDKRKLSKNKSSGHPTSEHI